MKFTSDAMKGNGFEPSTQTTNKSDSFVSPLVSNITVESGNRPKVSDGDNDKSKKFAYAFYSTSSEYGCSAIVAGMKIKELGIDPSIDVVMLHTGVQKNIVQAFTDIGPNFKEIHVEVQSSHLKSFYYYKYSFAKIYIFSLYKYTRIIFMDSDGIPLHNLDHLFHLPPTTIAAPRSYWINPNGFTSAFLVVEPSLDTFEMLKKTAAGRPDENVFDMDLLNNIFGKSALLLPAEYCCLNSHWEVNNESPFKENLEDLYTDRCMYLHYTAYGKPWTSKPEIVKAQRPNAHPLFEKQFAEWWRYAKKNCPQYKNRA